MSNFATALRALLAERGVSQARLARQLGVSPQAVSSWTSSGIMPTRDNVTRIEDELAVDPRGSLLMLAGYNVNDPEPPSVESTIRADPGIDPEDKRVLLRIVKLARERNTVEADEALL